MDRVARIFGAPVDLIFRTCNPARWLLADRRPAQRSKNVPWRQKSRTRGHDQDIGAVLFQTPAQCLPESKISNPHRKQKREERLTGLLFNVADNIRNDDAETC